MTSIDERVVAMKFNNTQFENGLKTTSKSLELLRKSLKLDDAKKSLNELDDAGKKFSMDGLANGVQGMGAKFTALAVIGITALANIASKAVDTGITLVKSLTVDPIKQGLQEYETQLNSIQTVLANTQSKGTTLTDVNGALAELNTYADKTIYNFSEMTRNIGTFTAAGIDLETSTSAIKGIANLAALSGSNSQQASTAMYQLSQALSSGSVKLMDWNSVVNAGMGGQVFQDALKETARNQGIAVDSLIEKNGSFRESLQEGWLTSGVLTETLSKMTGDLNAEQLKTMGYTEEQIQGIMQMATTASDAATKVKTATQLIDTLKEAVGSGWSQTFMTVIGDFEEAKTLFTAVSDTLGGMIGKSADARNNMLKDWKAGGGRDLAIEAIVNAFKALLRVIAPIRRAFEEIFPPVTGAQLVAITRAVANFTEKLKINGEMSRNLQKTFRGVFAVFDILFEVVKGVASVFGRLVSAVFAGTGGFLEFTGGIGDALVKMRDAIKSGDGLTSFFNTVGDVIVKVVGYIRDFFGILGAIFGSLGNIDLSSFDGGLSKLGARLEPLGAVGQRIKDIFEGLGPVLEKVKKFFSPFAEAASNLFGGIGTAMSNAFKNVDFSEMLDLVNTGLLAGLVLTIKKFLNKGIPKSAGGGIKGFFGTITGVFTQLTDTLSAMQSQLKAATLLTIAGAIAIMTIAVVALAGIDSAALTRSLTAITVMFTQLGVALSIFSKIAVGPGMLKLPILAGSLILLAIAIDLLAVAVTKLSKLDWLELAKGLTGVIVLLGAMAGVMKIMPKSPGGMIATGLGLIAIAIAVNILADAVKKFAGLSWEELAKGLVGATVTLGVLSRFTQQTKVSKGFAAQAVGIVILAAALKILASAVKDFGQLSPEELIKGVLALAVVLKIISAFGKSNAETGNMVKTAVGLVILAASLKIFASAVKDFGSMSIEELAKGLGAMAVALKIVSVAMNSMPKNMIVSAISLAVVAASLLLVAKAVGQMGGMTWDEIGRGLTVLAASLVIIAGAMYLMTAALPGALALIVVAGALAILAPVIQTLGNMTWDQIGAGLGVLASTLGIIAGAALILTPVIPSLILLGIAAGLIGVGAALAGAGMLAFSAGMVALSVAGAAGVTAAVAIVSALVGLIPAIAEGLGLGVVAFAEVIGQAAPAFAGAITAVLSAMLTAIGTIAPQLITTLVDILIRLINAIVELVPRIIEAAVVLITALVEALVRLIPLLVDAGLRMLVGILTGIRNNIGKIVEVVVAIITNFIDAISRSLPRIAQSGANLIISFVESLAGAVRNNSERMSRAGVSLATAIIEGMVSGITGGVDRVVRAARKMASDAFEAAKKFLEVNSPSKKFIVLGKSTGEGFAGGIDAMGAPIAKAAIGMGETAISAMKKALEKASELVPNSVELNPTITPVVDLTNLRNASPFIDDLLSASPIDVQGAYAKAANISQQRSSREEDVVTATSQSTSPTIMFTQNNTSPKALSKGEIYRQTKNQLSIVKEGLLVNA